VPWGDQDWDDDYDDDDERRRWLDIDILGVTAYFVGGFLIVVFGSLVARYLWGFLRYVVPHW
jgi:hypothetical protein